MKSKWPKNFKTVKRKKFTDTYKISNEINDRHLLLGTHQSEPVVHQDQKESLKNGQKEGKDCPQNICN